MSIDPGKLALSLTPADTDPPLRSQEYQAGLNEVASALRAQGIEVSYRMHMEESVEGHTILRGDFTIGVAKAVGPVLGSIVGAWLMARFGRKARLKVGDIEAEARTVEEVEKLLKRAEQFRSTKAVHRD